MPEVEEVDIELDMKDVQWDTYAASSSGWQNANKNQTWVRLHHKPSGIIVTIGDSKSQLHNKEKAFAILRSKLYEREMLLQQQEEKLLRGSQVGTWDRSEKIRTYNFPQDRITDHRVKQSWSHIQWVLWGWLHDIVMVLVTHYQMELLAEQSA